MARSHRNNKTRQSPGRPQNAPGPSRQSDARPDDVDDDEVGDSESPVALLVDELGDDPDQDEALDDPLAAALVPVGARPAPLAPVRDPVQRFLAETRHYPRLTEAEERELIEAVRGQDSIAAARKLVVHNLRLVVSIAYQYRRAWTNMLDLFQEGSVGLMEAVHHWDPALGTRFGSYAAYWIRAYILRFLMRNARMIHVGNTRAGRKLFFRLEKERARLRAAGFDPTPRLLATNLQVSERELEEVSQHLDSREVSLAPRPDGEGLSLDEKLSAPAEASPEDQAARSLLSESIRTVMDRFAASLEDERERAVWQEHLAAADDPVSLGALGQRFGVSKQRMGQIADRLKKRFRAELENEFGPDIQMTWQSGD